MKKMIALLLACAMILSLAACGTTSAETDPDRGGIQQGEVGKRPSKFPKETESEEEASLSVEIGKNKNTINDLKKDSALLLKVIWSSLSGKWIDNQNNVIYFGNENGEYTFLSGTTSQSYPYRRDPGTPTKVTLDNKSIATLVITYPPINGEAADSLDLISVTETLKIDLSSLDTTKRLRQIRVSAPGGSWSTYTKTSGTYENTDPDIPETPSDPVNQTTEAPTEVLTIDSLWELLRGCWIGPDERFAYFTYADGEPAYLAGLWEAPEPVNRGPATAYLLLDRGDGQWTLDVTYPPIEGATDYFGASTYDAVIYLDLSRMEQEHVLLILGNDGQWLPYVWGGVSYDDAYDAAHDTHPWVSFALAQSTWQKVIGSWGCAEGEIITFDQMDSETLLFEHHPAGTEASRWGTVAWVEDSVHESILCCMIYYPAEGDQPEAYEYLLIDIYDQEAMQMIYVQIGENGEQCIYIEWPAD